MVATTFKNEFLSFSRLSRFEQCPKAFELKYVRGEPGEPPNESLKLGSLLHSVLEDYVRSRWQSGYRGPVESDALRILLAARWKEADLASMEPFEEAAAMLADFAEQHGDFDASRILGVETEFLIDVGPFKVKGYIDRIDRLEGGGVEVVDYKTNRLIFSREEVDGSLQLSIYAMAVRGLFPDATDVRLSFHLLRHGFKMTTTRTDEQLAVARDYIEALGRQTEEAIEYPARLNPNCVYCDYRRSCPAYARALLGEHEEIPPGLDELERIAFEREQVASVAKIAYARKAKLEGILKAHLRDRDDLVLGGMRYSIGETTRLSYPTEPTLSILAEETGEPRAALANRLLAVEKAKVDALLKEMRKDRTAAEVRLVQTKLEAVAEKAVSPRFNARKAVAS